MVNWEFEYEIYITHSDRGKPGLAYTSNEHVFQTEDTDSFLETEEGFDGESSVDYGEDFKNQWIACQEVESGRVVYYNYSTLNVITDPETLEYEDIDGVIRNVRPIKSQSIGDFNAGSKMIHDPENLLSNLVQWQGDLEILLQQSFLSEEVREKLDDARKRTTEIIALVEDEERQADKTDVEAIVSGVISKWDFDNINVHGYRVRAARIMPHSELIYPDFFFPRYYSHSPLPASHLAPIECTITLCPEIASEHGSKRIVLTIKADDTASSIIDNVFDQFSFEINSDEYVLKGQGLDEYMDDAEIMFNYETIRNHLRRREAVNLILCQYPIEPVESADIQNNERSYIEKASVDLPVLMADDFRGLSIENKEWHDFDVIPLHECHWGFQIRIIGADHVNMTSLPLLDQSITSLSVKTFIYHGTKIHPSSIMFTEEISFGETPRWNTSLEPIEQEILISSLPRESRICFMLSGSSIETKEDEILAWVSINLIDQFGQLQRGRKTLRLWPKTSETEELLNSFDYIFRGTCVENLSTPHGLYPCMLSVDFDKFSFPIVSPYVEPYKEPDITEVGAMKPWNKLSRKVRTRMDDLVKVDPLYLLSEEDQAALWESRHHLVKFPQALARFLQSVDWFSQESRHEAHRMLKLWAPPKTPVSAIELLDARYADYSVRKYAVNCLRILEDDELKLFLLQLVQTLKFEPYHDSDLARFLLERALLSPLGIGHSLFWHLKAESVYPETCERYALIMEEYLSFSGFHTKELRKQIDVINKLTRVASMIATLKKAKEKTDAEIMSLYHERLTEINERYLSLVGSMQIPLNPKWRVTTLAISKCRYMSSKMAPLWLVFRNADPEGDDIRVIFKSGDDLRQDILTLQLLQVMDKIWLSEGIDMRLTPYTCVAAGVNLQGKGVGMIEVVLNSETTSKIQLQYGGGAVGALRMEPLAKYLEHNNADGENHNRAVNNFIRSCAGYCVATFVLGIGDRHNSNIMITEDGHLFHIDFGHFLGNFKSKFGIKRERAAFVLTPEMAYVMGGRKYKKATNFQEFESLSTDAFAVLRKHADLFINLFILMVSARMPELLVQDDINYLRDKFFLNQNPKEAKALLRKEIKKSLNTTYRSIDNFIHNLRHGGK